MATWNTVLHRQNHNARIPTNGSLSVGLWEEFKRPWQLTRDLLVEHVFQPGSSIGLQEVPGCVWGFVDVVLCSLDTCCQLYVLLKFHVTCQSSFYLQNNKSKQKFPIYLNKNKEIQRFTNQIIFSFHCVAHFLLRELLGSVEPLNWHGAQITQALSQWVSQILHIQVALNVRKWLTLTSVII